MSRSCKGERSGTAASDDPFGPDGFGDTWEPTLRAVSRRDSDEWPLQLVDDNIASDWDWGTSAQGVRARRMAEQAKRKKEREEWMESRVKALREAKAKALAIAEADAEAKEKEKEKAVALAIEEADAAQEKIAADEWLQFKVKQATDFVAYADPEQALTTLSSLTHENKKLLDWIDEEQKKEVDQFYAAIFDRQRLLRSLSAGFEGCSFSYLNNRPASSEIDESKSDESTIGSDTVREYHEDGEAGHSSTLLVDRLPTHHVNETNESSCVDTTVGGDTVKANPSNTKTGDSDTESGSATVVVDRRKSFGGTDDDNNNNNTMK